MLWRSSCIEHNNSMKPWSHFMFNFYYNITLQYIAIHKNKETKKLLHKMLFCGKKYQAKNYFIMTIRMFLSY